MKHYELLTLVSGKYAEHELEPVTTLIDDTLRKHGALIQFTNSWGRRKLAYPVDHNFYGYYIFSEFDGDPTAVNLIDRDLRLSNEIMRHHIAIKVPGQAPIIPFGWAKETIVLSLDRERTPSSSNSSESPRQIQNAVEKVVADASSEVSQGTQEPATTAATAEPEVVDHEELNKKLDEILNNEII